MTLLQVGAALVIAAAALHATSERGTAFAIAYGAFRLILANRRAAAPPSASCFRRSSVRRSISLTTSARADKPRVNSSAFIRTAGIILSSYDAR